MRDPNHPPTEVAEALNSSRGGGFNPAGWWTATCHFGSRGDEPRGTLVWDPAFPAWLVCTAPGWYIVPADLEADGYWRAYQRRLLAAA